MSQDYRNGLRDGIPIALGYFAVSFSLGIMMLEGGIPTLAAAFMSLTNLTSAGQFAGARIIIAGGTIIEIIITQLIINLRYALMSLSLSQKLSADMTIWQRMIVAFANTDEIFAMAMARAKEVTFRYMLGLQILPIIGWVSGTVAGCVAADLLPASVGTAMSVALYGMFIAIVVPVAKNVRPVLIVVAIAILISSLLYYVPFLSFISDGIGIVLSTVIASCVGAFLFPIDTKEKEQQE